MTSQYPPGWYPDAQGVTRWWDGTQWTQHTQPGGAPQPQAGAAGQGAASPQGAGGAGQPGAAAGSGPTPMLLAAIFGASLAAIGSVGPWGKLGGLSASGTEGGDGYIVIVCVAIGAALVWLGTVRGRRWPFVTAFVLAALAALVGVIDLGDVSDKGLDVGWGLPLVLLGSVVLAVLSLILMARRPRR